MQRRFACNVSTFTYYCINGIERGYLNTSPRAALMLPIVMQTIFKMPSAITIGIPIKMIIRGRASMMYSSIERLKFMAALPFMFTQAESSLLDNQKISGPMIPPKGKKNPANAERWQSMAQFLSDSVKSLFSSISVRFS